MAGINPTRRGPELARDILHTDCRVLVTERAHLPLLDGLTLPGVRVLVTDPDNAAYAALLAPYAAAEPGDARLGPVGPGSRLLLCFTSGSTGAPKAAICSQGRLAAAGASLVRHFGVREDDVHYICMPLFHGNAVIANWAPALALRDGVSFDPVGFGDFLASQTDLGTKMAPRFVRVLRQLPVTATNKIHRVALRRAGFGCEEPVWWLPPGSAAYRRLTKADRTALLAQYGDHGRAGLLAP